MADLQSAARYSQVPKAQGITETAAAGLQERLQEKPEKQSEIDLDLARVMAAWPALPEPIRRAALALVESWRSQS